MIDSYWFELMAIVLVQKTQLMYFIFTQFINVFLCIAMYYVVSNWGWKQNINEATRVLGVSVDFAEHSEKKEPIPVRVSIVNQHGCLLYDSLIKPHLPHSHTRTLVRRGILRDDLEFAPTLAKVKSQVLDIIEGRFLVGNFRGRNLHLLTGVHHDDDHIRDLALLYPDPLFVSRSLKELCTRYDGELYHSYEDNCPGDAHLAMDIWKVLAFEWEGFLLKKASIL